jgi:hypothetical protein
MAIKGKGRTRSRRMVAAPPRPQIVVRSKPILLRRSTWLVAGLVVLAAIGFGVFRWWDDRQASALLNREQVAIQELAQRVTDALPADRQTPQGTTQVAVFPSIVQTMDQIDSAKLSRKRSVQAAAAVEGQATKAAAGIQSIALQSIVKSDFTVGVTPDLTAPGMTSSVLNVAQDQMVRAFQLYGSIGSLMKAAAELPQGPKRSAIITQARAEVSVAADLFGRGYNALVQIQSQLGLIANTGLQPSPPAG